MIASTYVLMSSMRWGTRGAMRPRALQGGGTRSVRVSVGGLEGCAKACGEDGANKSAVADDRIRIKCRVHGVRWACFELMLSRWRLQLWRSDHTPRCIPLLYELPLETCASLASGCITCMRFGCLHRGLGRRPRTVMST